MKKHPRTLLIHAKPYYRTKLGAAYLGDSLDLLKHLKSESIHLIITSPPFALTKQKKYGTKLDSKQVNQEKYVEWFVNGFSEELRRVLAPNGSLVMHMGGSWVRGKPLKSLYHYELAVELAKHAGFGLAQEFYWVNTARLPTPAQWVTIKRIRVKDAVDPVFWFCKNSEGITKANNKRVLQPYSESMKRLLRLQSYNSGLRPSGHAISSESFLKRHKGAIPPNWLLIGGTESSSPYLRNTKRYDIERNPARYPVGLVDFFVKFLTRKGDVVLDPFAGSNSTGASAEHNQRRWLAFEIYEPYLQGSKFRFWDPQELGLKPSLERPVQDLRM